MNFKELPTNLSKHVKDSECNHLLHSTIPDILLPTQNGNLLRLNRIDTFRLVIFCYPMTGRPDRSLPNYWDLIPGASGCTILNCLLRDNYDNFIIKNSLPIGISTQSILDIKEMTVRLRIPYDVLSDQELIFASSIKLPTFSIENKKFLKRVTMIIEKSVVKKVFYPILSPKQHIVEVLNWLNNN